MPFTQIGSTLAQVEREHILRTLGHCDGNRARSAKALDISIRCLRNKLHEYTDAGIEVPSPKNGISLSATKTAH